MLRRLVIMVGALTMVMAAAPAAVAGGGCHGPITDEEGTTVVMEGLCFTPTVVRVAEGDTVTWENADSTEHNVVSAALPGYGTATLRRGGSASITFDDPGIYPYVCSFHPGMTGAVVVGDADAPQVAVDAVASVDIERRLSALELAAEDALPPVIQPTADQAAWPPLVIGLLAGLVIGALVMRVRRG
jgi:plastocyanin/tetrahydromethanopterin S-methyltransferase subunit G